MRQNPKDLIPGKMYFIEIENLSFHHQMVFSRYVSGLYVFKHPFSHVEIRCPGRVFIFS